MVSSRRRRVRAAGTVVPGRPISVVKRSRLCERGDHLPCSVGHAEGDLTAFYLVPREHWTKLRSTNPLERVNKEIGRRSDVVGSFPNDAAAIRLAGALLSEQNDSG